MTGSRSTAEASLAPPACSADEGADLIDVARRRTTIEYLRAMWDRREFAFAYAFGEMRAQNQDTLLGNLWHLMNPLMLTAVFFLLFGVLFERSARVEPFLPFLVIGIFTFQFTMKVVMGGARAVVNNVNMMQNLRFPRAVLPVAAVIQETTTQYMAMAAMLVLTWVVGIEPSWSWLAIFPVLLLQSAFNLGLALLVARATFHLRDVEQLLPYVLRILFYISGTFFTMQRIAERADWAAFVLSLNPLNAYMSLIRRFVMRDPSVHAAVSIRHIWIVALVAPVITIVIGMVWFRAAEHRYGFA